MTTYLSAEPPRQRRQDHHVPVGETTTFGLMLAIKHQVDLDTGPGQFLLTGSARLLGMREIPDLLPGRTETIELWPLSQGELDSAADLFVESVFDQGADLRVPPSGLHRGDCLRRALAGGCPEAVRRTDRAGGRDSSSPTSPT